MAYLTKGFVSYLVTRVMYVLSSNPSKSNFPSVDEFYTLE
jgi:hypothetical protein